MNNRFDMGGMLGRFFWSIVDNQYFTGVSFRVGVEEELNRANIVDAFAISIQIGYIMISIGYVIHFRGDISTGEA